MIFFNVFFVFSYAFQFSTLGIYFYYHILLKITAENNVDQNNFLVEDWSML